MLWFQRVSEQPPADASVIFQRPRMRQPLECRAVDAGADRGAAVVGRKIMLSCGEDGLSKHGCKLYQCDCRWNPDTKGNGYARNHTEEGILPSALGVRFP